MVNYNLKAIRHPLGEFPDWNDLPRHFRFPCAFFTLTPMFPLETTITPVSPLFPLDTKTGGGRGVP
jgi:hypothetical protein